MNTTSHNVQEACPQPLAHKQPGDAASPNSAAGKDASICFDDLWSDFSEGACDATPSPVGKELPRAKAVKSEFTPLKLESCFASAVGGDMSTRNTTSTMMPSSLSASSSSLWDDDVQGDDDGAVHSTSLDAPLPSGPVFVAVRSIRATINKYVDNTAACGWYGQFRLGTVQAVLRRLQKHSPTILGNFHIDVQVGFKQLKGRGDALTEIHKVITKWAESQNEMWLAELVPPFEVLEKYLAARGLVVAADLMLLVLAAKVFQKARQGQFKEGVASIRMDGLRKTVEVIRFDAKTTTLAPMLPPIKQEPQEGEVKEELEESEPAHLFGGAQLKSRRGSIVRGNPDLKSRIDFAASAACHADRIIVSAIKPILYQMRSDIFEEPDVITNRVEDFEAVERFWSEAKKSQLPEEREEITEAHDLAASLTLICKCAREGSKPLASVVRKARRTVLQTVQSKHSFVAELAKAFTQYPCGKTLMAYSKEYAAAGMEDDVATETYRNGEIAFEAHFELAFDDIEAWTSEMLTKEGYHGEMFLTHLRAVASFMGCVMNAAVRMSDIALQSIGADIWDFLGNVMAILQVGIYIQARDVFDNFERVFLASLPTPTPHMEVGAQGSTEDTEGVEAQELAPASALSTVVVAEASPAPEGEEMVNLDVFLKTWVGLDPDISKQTETLTKSLCEVAATVHNVRGKLLARSIRSQSIADEQQATEQTPIDLGKDLQQNFGTTKSTMAYFALFQTTLNSFVFGNAPESAGDQNNIVLEFARSHQAIVANPPTLCVSGAMSHLHGQVDLAKIFKRVHDAHLDQIYFGIEQQFLVSWQDAIAAGRIKVSAVHSKVAQDLDLPKLFPSMIPNCDPNVIVKGLAILDALDTMPAGDPEVETVINALSHNVAFGALTKFLNITKEKEFELRFASDTSTTSAMESRTVLTADGILLLRIACIMKDAVILAAHLHRELHSRSDVNDRKRVFGFIASVLHSFHNKVTVLDGILQSTDAVGFEERGAPSPVPFAFLRQWQGSMSIYGGRAQTAFLQACAKFVEVGIKHASAACPSWEACLKKGRLDSRLAKDLMSPKLKVVVDTHNALFADLSRTNACGKLLKLAPRLQDHPVTSSIISLAVATLSSSSRCSTMIMGVNLILDFGLDANGPEKAKQFVAKHKKDDQADTSGIPSSFWKEMRLMEEGSVDIAPRLTCDRPEIEKQVAKRAKMAKVELDETAVSTHSGSSGQSSGQQSSDSLCSVANQASGDFPAGVGDTAPVRKIALKRSRRER